MVIIIASLKTKRKRDNFTHWRCDFSNTKEHKFCFHSALAFFKYLA